MRKHHLSIVTFSLFALLPITAFMNASPQSQEATAPAEQKEPRPWTVDDIIKNETAGQFEISPDGRWVVWAKTVADEEKNARVSHLMLSNLTEKKTIQLTRGSDSETQPRWSPSGQLIAFISTRPVPKSKASSGDGDQPRPQIWVINPFGGEPWHLTDSERSVRSLEWAGADTIIFTAQEDPSLHERTIKEKKDTSIVVEDHAHEPPVRLFKLVVGPKQVTRLTENDDWIQQLAVSPDGTYAATIHERSLSFTYDQRVKPLAFLHNLKTNEHQQLFTDGQIHPEQIRWMPDSKGFYVSSAYSRHPVYLMATISLMYHYDLAAGATTQVNLEWGNGLLAGFEATSDGFIAPLADGARPKLARYTRQADGKTWTRTWIEGDHATNIFELAISDDNKTIVYEHSTASKPIQWFQAKLDGAALTEAAQLTDLNPQLRNRVVAKTEIVRWQGARDEEVEGVLYYPHNYEAGKKYPLVVMIHGGPAGVDMDEWSDRVSYPHNLMAQRGAFLLKPNYHGSAGYGLDWVESIGGGNYYDLEVPDIEKGVDDLIARGLIDPEKLGVMGWSNGAILTTALTVTTTRYKVASAGAGDVDWASDWGNCEFGAAFDNYYIGASPLEDPELYIKKSPFYRMENVKTPTILFHGTEDTAVPTQQSWMHYRALQQLGQTDVRFILFPGEPHGLRKLAHQRRKIEEELAWFDKYLFKTHEAKNEALKPDSPLAVALKKKSFERAGERFGVLVKGILTPETVKYDGLEVGRFEITRAQYAAFDKNYVVAPGRENHPASNISFDQAKSYCAWLSQLTGQTYRLGTEAEMKPIYEAAKGEENTLDYWAGYKLNLDDAERLASELQRLDGQAPLLKPVGSFNPMSQDDLIFDLGGNVAEWVIGADGSGQIMGSSADTPADPKLRQRKPAIDYLGFRIIKGAPQESR